MRERNCGTCKYNNSSIVNNPCSTCGGYHTGYSNWEWNQEVYYDLIAENKRLKEEAQSAISFAAKIEIEALRSQLAKKDKEIIKLKDANEALQDCLNGSSKAVYTAEMYDELKRQLAEKDKEIRGFENNIVLFGSQLDAIKDLYCRTEKAEVENAELRERLKALEKGAIK